MGSRLAIVIVASVLLLASCASDDAEPSASSAAATTTAQVTTTTGAPGEVLEFCAAGEVFIRNYEDADYAREFDPSELRAFMERGHAVTTQLGAEAPLEVQLSMKAVAAAFGKRRDLYSAHDYVIGAVTPDENSVLAAVEVDVEDSEQRMHDYLVTRCGISL